MPQITVIVPVYKVEPYLCRCVDSILNQTFSDFELILVDDGSPDGCGTICDEYSTKDSCIHVIHQSNGGLSAARNAGIDWAFVCSDSEWLTFIDSDDWIDVDYLSILLSSASTTGTDVSSCRFMEVPDSNKNVVNAEKTIKKLYFEEFYSSDIQGLHPIQSCVKLYRKKLFSTIRFPIGKLNEDLYTTHQVLFLSNYIVFVDYFGYYYNKRGDSITGNPWSKRKMDEIFGSEELIHFMKKRGLTNGKKWATQWYYWVLLRQIDEITEVKEYYKREHKALLRRLGFLLIWNKELFPFNDNKWYYELAFPKLMWLYWVSMGMKKRIKRLVKKDGKN